MAARIHCGRNALQRNVQHRIINYGNCRFGSFFLINLIVMQFLGSLNIRIYIISWRQNGTSEECAAEFVRTLARGLRWVSRHLGRRSDAISPDNWECRACSPDGIAARERDVTWAAITAEPDAVAPSDCRRLSANLRNFSQSLDLQLVQARRSSRAAGDSSAAVWVAALGQDCIDVLICSLDFLLFFYFRLQLFTELRHIPI